MLTILTTILLTLPILALLRWIVSRRITTLMGRSSPTACDPLSAFAATPETPMKTEPRLEIIDADSVPPEASAARSAAARTARKMFGKWWRTEALAVLGYLGLAAITLFPFDDDPVETLTTTFALMPLIYLVIVSLRYVFWFRQYTAVRSGARLSSLLRFVGTIAFALPRVLMHPGNAWLPSTLCAVGVLLIAFFYMMSGEEILIGGVAVFVSQVAAVGLHARLLWRFRDSVQTDKGPSVAMLRVFGIDRHAYFTFGSMLDSWKHFGPSFTIIDPAFFRYRYRSFSAGNVGMVLWLGTGIIFAMMMLLANTGMMTEQEIEDQGVFIQILSAIVAAALLTIGYAMRLAWYLIILPSYFVKDTAQIEARMDAITKRPRNYDMTFRNVHMFCHDNTWRVAVDQFVARADIVLMDLRGYTPERQGCEYEVDFLFDKAPLGRVLFLIDEHTDAEAVGALIRERWAELRVTSPNLSDPDPVARIYRTGGAARSDVRGLLDLMFAGAAHQPGQAPRCKRRPDGSTDDCVATAPLAVGRPRALGFGFAKPEPACPPKPPPPIRFWPAKYRPGHFRDLVGQEIMVDTLRNAFEHDRIAHAFMLTGVRGIGKTTTARIIAKGLNCERDGRPTIDPCGVCDACVRIAAGQNVDVIEMDAASNTGVDDVREIVDAVRYRAATARYKVYIVDESTCCRPMRSTRSSRRSRSRRRM